MLRRTQADREKPLMLVTVEHIGSTEPHRTIEAALKPNARIDERPLKIGDFQVGTLWSRAAARVR
jgi:hypothetical protein